MYSFSRQKLVFGQFCCGFLWEKIRFQMLLTLKLSSVCSKTWKKQKLILYKMWHNFSINSTSGPKEPGFYCTTLGNHFVIFQTQCNKLYLSRSCSFKENFFGWPYNTVHFRSNERPFCYFKEEIQRYMYHLFFPIFKLKNEVCFFSKSETMKL